MWSIESQVGPKKPNGVTSDDASPSRTSFTGNGHLEWVASNIEP